MVGYPNYSSEPVRFKQRRQPEPLGYNSCAKKNNNPSTSLSCRCFDHWQAVDPVPVELKRAQYFRDNLVGVLLEIWVCL